MSAIATFLRAWYYSAASSPRPIRGVVAEVDITGQVSVVDSIEGANSYGVQLNAYGTDDWCLQAVAATAKGSQTFEFETGYQYISSEHGSYLFGEPLSSVDFFNPGGGFLLSLTKNPDNATMNALLWPRKNGALQGLPILHQISEVHDITSASLDIVGRISASEATFASGSFDVSVKVETDGPTTLGVVQAGQGLPTMPVRFFNTGENSNLVEDLISSDPLNGFYELSYHL